ncbi:transglutaminase domain-containing protein [Paenibacillus donghaensis]|uniref:Transglutaminase n=1 Tax=Paenibacillus donghaensis TaxID=414771 RepID=A0A2Z2KBV1_9BACL|nr:transglutaminase domain-containing protein [Paenibacillus donghaensis]ASA24186.1 transglutaminase [Paenibacillus donghaensis]
MKKRSRGSLVKAILGVSLVAGAIPPAVYLSWSHVNAAAHPASLKSVSEMTQKLTASMNNRRETITFTFEGKTSQLKPQVQSAINHAMASDPYLYYIVDSYGYSYQGGARSAKVTVQMEYRETLQQTAYVNQQVKAALKKLILPGMNNHQKVKVIHDWVVRTLQYDTTYSKYTAYEGLKSGSAVCQGYSLLTYKLLKEAGIPNRIVEGTAKPEGGSRVSHAWNLVQLDGKWYHLDTTWDDPVPDQPGEVVTAYYLRTDAQLRKDHSWTKPYPAASTAYHKTLAELVSGGGQAKAWFKALQQELNYELYDESRIVAAGADLAKLGQQALSSGKHSLLFRYKGSKKQLQGDLQQLYQLGLNQLSYSTSSFDNTGDLKVYVTWK